MKHFFLSRWIKAIFWLCWWTLLTISISGATIYVIVRGSRDLLGFGDGDTLPAIALIVLGLVLFVFVTVFGMFAFQTVWYQMPATIALQKLARLNNTSELSEQGMRLAYAIRFCERPLGEASTKNLICELVRHFSTLRPDLLDATRCEERIRRYEDEVTALGTLIQERRGIKSSHRKQNIVGKLLFGIIGNAMAFHRISSAEQAELDPVNQAIAATKINLARLDKEFADAVANSIETKPRVR
ncbi:MAG: hypothetical protein Q8M16_17990 [Pirellulaceae bacterium]|nr:hypothetical protein [Pirellulaceae bacterium]